MRDKRQPITRAARAVGDGHIDAMEEARATGGDVGAVSKFGFLAAKMPSVLTRLRPMQSSSAGMLSYLFGPARIVGPTPASRFRYSSEPRTPEWVAGRFALTRRHE